jgi:hypothetical protein
VMYVFDSKTELVDALRKQQSEAIERSRRYDALVQRWLGRHELARNEQSATVRSVHDKGGITQVHCLRAAAAAEANAFDHAARMAEGLQVGPFPPAPSPEAWRKMMEAL